MQKNCDQLFNLKSYHKQCFPECSQQLVIENGHLLLLKLNQRKARLIFHHIQIFALVTISKINTQTRENACAGYCFCTWIIERRNLIC